ncbi:SWIB complex BAF60b domain-containing family protein [Hibiscus syriacus]|uniref:SWIB complex BAF60b domain-containing family protein n=1 Tax=Hibiscus syriacus TaxID=106335 RepID=A0A6A3C3F8_HIBSY|nr:SWIB complex BAF60b domain-containing family protein [Hibiscus syriacus]
MAILLRGKKSHYNDYGGAYLAQPENGDLRPVGEALTPLRKAPSLTVGKRLGSGLGQWVMGQLSRIPSVALMSYKRSDLRLLLWVMGAPLAPETSTAQYILQQYTAASCGLKLQNSTRNAYAMGKLKMVAYEYETATKTVKSHHGSRGVEYGGFVLWQMNPDMWNVELAVGGCKVHAGCNGKIVWRHTPWLGARMAKGPGLDPRTTASMFSDAKCIGEKTINGEDCFILELCTDPQTLKVEAKAQQRLSGMFYLATLVRRPAFLFTWRIHISLASKPMVVYPTLIEALIERWRLKTHMFYFPSGEATITLEDIAYQLGVPVNETPIVRQNVYDPSTLVFQVLKKWPPSNVMRAYRLKLGDSSLSVPGALQDCNYNTELKSRCSRLRDTATVLGLFSWLSYVDEKIQQSDASVCGAPADSYANGGWRFIGCTIVHSNIFDRTFEAVKKMMASNVINPSPYFEGGSQSVLGTPPLQDDNNNQGL